MKRTLPTTRLAVFLPVLLLLPLSGCSLVTDPADTLTLEVAEVRVPCIGAFPQQCYIVREGASGESQLFYDPILGFDYDEGYRYRLIVTRSRVRNPPQDGSSLTWHFERQLSREPSARADLLAETAAAEARWIASRPMDYEIVQQRPCFCGTAGLGSVRVGVTRSHFGEPRIYEHVTHVLRVEDGAVVAQELAFQFLSVQQLFRQIRWAVADDAHRIDVEFDDVAGYPRHISIDPRVEVSDDEFEYVVESVTGL